MRADALAGAPELAAQEATPSSSGGAGQMGDRDLFPVFAFIVMFSDQIWILRQGAPCDLARARARPASAKQHIQCCLPPLRPCSL